MGSGKSTVGRLVAERLGTEFADTDDEVERACGLSVAAIFELHGEPFFRRAESDALARLLAPGGPGIVAAGGGAVLEPANRDLMHRSAVVVWLRTDVATLTDRLGNGEGRPLLSGEDQMAERIEQLRRERSDLYESVAGIVLDTDRRSPESVAEAVVSLVSDPSSRGASSE
jgi:shikimate kinase